MPNNENNTSGCCGAHNTCSGRAARVVCAASACALGISCLSAIIPSIHIAGVVLGRSTLLSSSAITGGVGTVGCVIIPCIGHKCCGFCSQEVQINNQRVAIITTQPSQNIQSNSERLSVSSESSESLSVSYESSEESLPSCVPSAPPIEGTTPAPPYDNDPPPSYEEAVGMRRPPSSLN